MKIAKQLIVLFVFFIAWSCTKENTSKKENQTKEVNVKATNIATTLSEFKNVTSNSILVAAHRGAHMGNFENSIESSLKSIELGVDIIEVDVKTTKDGHLILMHDGSIDRTTTGTGKVEELTLAEIRSFKLKAPYGRVSKESVPTFEDFLKVVKGKIMVDVDMKTGNVEGLVKAVNEFGNKNEVFYFDNDYDQLDRIKLLDKTAQLMPRAYSLQMADSAVVKFSPKVVHIDTGFNTKEVGDLLKENNARIWINTLGEKDAEIRYGSGEKIIEELIKNGANIIQTDEPEMLLELLRSKGLHQ
ncbi:glycerophosphodiester phosphodiesterase family protein [Polaribacter undariae]|uniref:Glycerophosphodiester phosphodiesterase family protein n=1 Tax=Polaribacter sejongensis TaxID=985043 RepID=A0AAJ1QWP3_9FLAO|nr:glycerophosphodiester phosphodiesterase family protein [Polaribacter undariae]MDN3619510.1 glycerophosphodiester phosphodiesterase family protein [Polaribacter undariae]UWD32374.1 glycerophosphodiester phosphodiesterase family protein [Polaribacter undariae]